MRAATLGVRLFGGVDLRHRGEPLPPLGSGRAESLLAYLLLHRQAPQPRQRLAFLLWPDSTEAQARTNLRHVLHILRGGLPEPDLFLDVTARTLRWRPDGPYWLDVAAFEDSLARAAQPADDGGLAALQEAAELYTADFLEGSYDDWALGERQRLRQRHVGALERLVSVLEAGGEHGRAIGYAERLLRIEPLHEPSYRTLMRLHDRRGDRARALHVYQACAATLERELGVEPSTSTRAAYATLLATGAGTAGEGREALPNGERARGQETRPPLVGRTSEWERLTASWRQTEEGHAQLVLLTGEPGIGKTRLVEELRSWSAHRGAWCAEARSYRAEGALAYGPVVAWLRSPDLQRRLARLDATRRRELARLLPELAGEGRVDDAEPSAGSERDRRRRLFDAAASAVVVPGRRLLLVADDIHWSDPETLQFLHYLLRIHPAAPLMVAATARSGETGHHRNLRELVAGLHALGRVTEIEVGRLTPVETAALAHRVAGAPLGEPATRRLHAETEGNPLFVLEALRAGWEPGSAAPDRMSDKVQAVIESHLAGLPAPARDLVGVAAAVGREFSAELLASAGAVDEETVVRALDQLWRHRVLREHGTDTYDFSHDKVREVAYRGLGPAQRRRSHLRIARALEDSGGPDQDAVSLLVAAHYQQAGAAEAAAPWYRRAAEAAQRRHASAEAVRLLERALELLRDLPSTPARMTEELAALTALPAALTAVDGYASARVTEVHERAVEVAGTLGAAPDPQLLRSQAIANLTGGDFEVARRVGAELVARGERDGDGVLLVEGAYVLGVAAFWRGDFGEARAHLRAAVHRYRPEHREAHLSGYGQDPKVVCLGRLGNTEWFLGRPEAARQASDDAIALAREIGHPYSQAVSLVFAAVLALDSGDVDRLRHHVADLHAGQRDAPQIQVFVHALDGYLTVLDGGKEPGLARVQRTLDHPEAAVSAPGFDAVLARVLLAASEAAGDARQGLAASERALAAGPGSVVWEAEARRLRAVFLAGLGAPAIEVDQELQRALAVARRQGAVSLEQRVVTSLHRHRRVG